MFIVLATCILTGSMTFVPPADWTILKIEAMSWLSHTVLLGELGERGSHSLGGGPQHKVRIELQRDFRPGETLKAPEGCTLEVREKR